MKKKRSWGRVCLLMVSLSFTITCFARQAPRQQSPEPASNKQSQDQQSQQKTSVASSTPAEGFTPRVQRYELHPGDVIDLNFAYTPEFNQTVSVQPDGYISLRNAGEINVQGRTVSQLTQQIKAAYANVLHDPAISIVLKEFEKPHFVVTGQVGRPGKYELRSDTTVMEAIGIAGGYNERAKNSELLLFRRVSNDWVEVKKINLKKLYAGDYQEDIHIRPGDMLFLPQNRISKIKQYLPTSAINAYVANSIP